MQIDIQKFNEVAEAAKAKTNDKRWHAAIDKAVAGVTSGWWVITELAHCVAVTTEEGHTYFANGSCQCKAYELGQPCKHRALARLIELYNERSAAFADVETTAAISLADDVAASSRENLIAEIKNIWPRFAPGVPLETELMARFRVNQLEMLADDMLQGVRLAIAM
jgi:hypothetical protein